MLEHAETQWKKLGSSPIGEEAEIADAHEAARQPMEQEAAQELIDRQARHALPISVRGIPPSECDVVVVKGNEPMVGDGDAVGVA